MSLPSSTIQFATQNREALPPKSFEIPHQDSPPTFYKFEQGSDSGLETFYSI